MGMVGDESCSDSVDALARPSKAGVHEKASRENDSSNLLQEATTPPVRVQ